MISFHQLLPLLVCGLLTVSHAFVAPGTSVHLKTELQMGLFDKFIAGGSGRDRLDEEVSGDKLIANPCLVFYS